MSWDGRDREGSEGTRGREGRAAANPSGLGQDRMPGPLGFVPSDLQISHLFILSVNITKHQPGQSGCKAPGKPTREQGPRVQDGSFACKREPSSCCEECPSFPVSCPQTENQDPWLMCLSLQGQACA